jgi:hypothetical protein
MSHPVQEEDRIATGKILLTAFVSLAVFGVGVAWAVSIQRNEMKSVVAQMNPPSRAAVAGAPEVGIVYQWPFYTSRYAADKADELKTRLETYGWVNKDQKIAHIPIEQAIEKYVSQSGGAK